MLRWKMVEICYETRIVMERADGVSIRVGSPLLIFKWVGGNKKGFRKKSPPKSFLR